MPSLKLQKVVDHFELEVLYKPKDLAEVQIVVPDCTRPGLQLAGYYAHFGPDRIQLLGNMELAYLAQLSVEERRACLDKFLSCNLPCIIISRSQQVPEGLLEMVEKYQTPLLRTKEATSNFLSALIKFLNIELAPMLSMHGVLVEIYGEGIMILGESGVGKSETAMEIVKRGHRLIADDLVEVRRVSDTTLLGRAPEVLRHLIEIRGLGIMDVKELYGVSSVKIQENINFVINLELWDENKLYDRLGLQEQTTDILGISVPSITIPVRPGRNLAIIAEVAAINFRQRKMGYNAAQNFVDRMFKR